MIYLQLSLSLVQSLTDPSQKYGRPNEATPAKWQSTYKDYNAPLEEGAVAQPASEPVQKEEDVPAPSSPPSKVEVEESKDDEKKKRKRHEGETPEERAERKRKKKEKKEKKERRKSKQEKESDDSE